MCFCFHKIKLQIIKKQSLSKIAEAKAKLGSTEEHGFSTKRSSDGMARPNYEEMGYGEVAEAAEN